MTQQAGTVLVINHRAQILTVTNRHYGGMALPGGKCEGIELPIMAACRELWEETDLTAMPQDLEFLAERPSAVAGRFVSVFWARKVFGSEIAKEPNTVIEWLSFEQLCDRIPAAFAPLYRELFPNGVARFPATRRVFP